jgi:hypothetical protein
MVSIPRNDLRLTVSDNRVLRRVFERNGDRKTYITRVILIITHTQIIFM